MPPTSGKNPILDKLKKQGAGKAFEAHKNDETKMGGGGDLPSGIEGGIAQLVSAKLDVHKEGDHKDKPYILFQGIIVSPKVHNDVPLDGLRATKMVRLYDYRDKTMDDGVSNALNEMRKLGVDTAGLQLDDIEDALLALEQEGPHFRFRTWSGKPTTEFPNPIVNTEFRGKVEYNAPEGGDDVEDNSGTGGQNTTDGNSATEPDWSALGEAADSGDEEAQKQIAAAGAKVGVDTDTTATWSEAAAMIAEAGGGSGDEGGSEGGAADETPAEPQVGDFLPYKEKGKKKAEDCEVKQVFAKNKSVNLYRPSDKKTFKAVPWSEVGF